MEKQCQFQNIGTDWLDFFSKILSLQFGAFLAHRVVLRPHLEDINKPVPIPTQFQNLKKTG